jgi:hypothetical protein
LKIGFSAKPKNAFAAAKKKLWAGRKLFLSSNPKR